MPRRIAKKIFFKVSRTTGVRKLKPATGRKKPRRMYKQSDYLTLYAPSGKDIAQTGIGVGVAAAGIGVGVGAARGIWGREKKSPIKRAR